MKSWEPGLGATVDGAATRFRVWAPETELVEVVVETADGCSAAYNMTPGPGGFHQALIPGVGAGDLYRFRLDGRGPFPDPASRCQPYGVHGPSQVADWRHFEWSDQAWTGLPLEQCIFYEIHVGAFTPEGAFASAASRLEYLRDLGVTAIELMPVGDFPGRWNWGYDGVAPFAPARCYGEPDDLRRLIDRAHALGLAVFLDVVYNHLGPDGAYQSAFSPYYYSNDHTSPWGAGINFDGPGSEPVRQYFIENGLRWIHEYHFDGLRLDATHAIVDDSPRHILASLNAAVKASLAGSSRQVSIIAEDARNLAGIVKPASQGGWGLDGVWADDFHHHVRRALAGDSDGYYADFDGSTAGIAATIRQGWFYTGQFAPHFGGPRGTETSGVPLFRFILCVQNHDQIGNRAFGERLHHQIDEAAWRAVSVLLLLLPETPLLFMGQEWAASTPFLFFTDHHAELGALVTEGRRREFRRFDAFSDPEARSRIPDPQIEETFRASRLNWDELERAPHAGTLRLYRRLLELRRSLAGADFEVEALGPDGLLARRSGVIVIVQLRGSGRYRFTSEECSVLLTTEDASYTVHSCPPVIDTASLSVEFRRPGAVVFSDRALPVDGSSRLDEDSIAPEVC
ncbi:MAG TPA: malto-oligosyltrehalose trehalohydrolase [Bryobacteraceae bacterium]|jgi:maltooligosyltrehalose trehalohydrolase|nr:malto-oligosyltrehalose trehalohydrolase [Bryobacteraceae bacterium]